MIKKLVGISLLWRRYFSHTDSSEKEDITATVSEMIDRLIENKRIFRGIDKYIDGISETPHRKVS